VEDYDYDPDFSEFKRGYDALATGAITTGLGLSYATAAARKAEELRAQKKHAMDPSGLVVAVQLCDDPAEHRVSSGDYFISRACQVEGQKVTNCRRVRQHWCAHHTTMYNQPGYVLLQHGCMRLSVHPHNSPLNQTTPRSSHQRFLLAAPHGLHAAPWPQVFVRVWHFTQHAVIGAHVLRHAPQGEVLVAVGAKLSCESHKTTMRHGGACAYHQSATCVQPQPACT
jgi:hypothetical protein